MCGVAQDEFPLCSGRSGPELGASLYQLEQFCESCPVFETGYMSGDRHPFKENKDLLKHEDFPELARYSSLYADRL